MTDILIIEDNIEIGKMLVDFLGLDGYTVQLFHSGEEGLEYFFTHGAKLIILDIMLPGIDGFAVCSRIREEFNTPILIVSAKIDKEDKLNGILQGADDYIEKPYDIDILIAKIGGIFKRRYENNILICGDIKIDKQKRLVFKGDEELQLRSKEYELLLFLMENSGKVLSKEMLFNKIWGFDSFSEQQTLTVHIKWLRERIEENPKMPKHILTVWGVGYRFEQ